METHRKTACQPRLGRVLQSEQGRYLSKEKTGKKKKKKPCILSTADPTHLLCALWGLVTPRYSTAYIPQNPSYSVAYKCHSELNCLFGIKQNRSQNGSEKNVQKNLRLMKSACLLLNHFSGFPP